MQRSRIVIMLLSLLLLIAAAFFCLIYVKGRREDNEYEEWLKEFEQVKPDDTAYLSECLKINTRTVAWLTIPDTEIDFPIVQSDDNTFYLNHDFKNDASMLGNPFLDYRCNGDFSDFNSIIYGHHIRGGRVFSGLESFLNSAYFREHSTGYLTTQNQIYTLHFIASLNIDSRGFIYNVIFLTEQEKEEFLCNIREQAVCLSDFSAEELKDKRLVCLSTCSYQFEDARTVLAGYLE